MNQYSFLLSMSWYTPTFTAKSLREAVKYARIWLEEREDKDQLGRLIPTSYLFCTPNDFIMENRYSRDKRLSSK